MAVRTLAEYKAALRRQRGDHGDRGAVTTLAAAVTAGATAITVAATAKWPASGSFVLEGEIGTYTAKTATTATGIPASGDGSLSAHPTTGVEVMPTVISETDLLRVLNEALDEYSRWRPYRWTATLTATNGARRYAVPTGAAIVERIAYISATDQSEEDYPFVLERLDAGYVIDFGFYWSETKALTAYCSAPHAAFATAGCTVPVRDEHLILMIAEAFLERMLARDSALRDRVTRLSITNDPSPSQKSHQDLWHGLLEEARAEMQRPVYELAGENILPVGKDVKTNIFPFGDVCQ